MAALEITYRHTPDGRPHYIKSNDIEQVALQVRRQLGSEARPRLELKELAGIYRLRVNGIDYETWVDVDNVVHDDDGNEVLGVFEFMPEVGVDAVNICVSPVSGTRRAEVVLSSLAHEFGHGIFDAPCLIAGQRTPSLFGNDPAHSRAFRAVTDTPAHLKPEPAPQPGHIRLAEWRANEFMGLLLVPRELLAERVTEEAMRRAVKINYHPSMCGPSVRDFAELVITDYEATVSLPEITRALAPMFGVTPKFIEVRMKKYGLISEEALAH
jgi:hypothetical protein